MTHNLTLTIHVHVSYINTRLGEVAVIAHTTVHMYRLTHMYLSLSALYGCGPAPTWTGGGLDCSGSCRGGDSMPLVRGKLIDRIRAAA